MVQGKIQKCPDCGDVVRARYDDKNRWFISCQCEEIMITAMGDTKWEEMKNKTGWEDI